MVFASTCERIYSRIYSVSLFEAKGDKSGVEFIVGEGKVVGFELRSGEGRVGVLFKKTFALQTAINDVRISVTPLPVTPISSTN